MKKVTWGNTNLKVPAIAVGCMRLKSLDMTAAAKHIENAVAHASMIRNDFEVNMLP